MKKENILIVGGTGFIGYHLAISCVKKNFSVTCISTKIPSIKRRVKKAKYIRLDISNKKEVKKKITQTYDYVVNLGGYVNHKDKKKTYNSHFIGCRNLADIFMEKKLKAFVQMGSSMEYGKNTSPLNETFKCNPSSIYGEAKFLASKLLLQKYKKNQFPIIILRLFQAYGPHQDVNRLIPIIINGCLKNEKIACSTGEQLRDFVYIDDVIKAIFLSLKSKKALGKIINIGFGRPKKVKNVIQMIKNIIGKGHPEFGKIKMRKDEIKVLYPNLSKAKKILRWRPKVKLNNGLKKTIRYYAKAAS